MNVDDRHLLHAVARAGDPRRTRWPAPQLDRHSPWLFEAPSGPVPPFAPPRPPAQPAAVPSLVMENGLGGFTPDGREYVDRARGRSGNAAAVVERDRQRRVRDRREQLGRGVHLGREQPREPSDAVRQRSRSAIPTGEAIYLRDEDSGEVWGATPGPLPRSRDGGRWIIRHAAGITRYQHAVAGLEQELTVSVDPTQPVKLSRLTLTNTSPRPRRLSVFGYVEWCLGPPRAGERRFVVTEIDAASGALLRAEHLQPGVCGTGGVLSRDGACPFVDLRSDRIHRAQQLAGPTGGARARSAPGTCWRRARSVRGAADRARNSRRRITAGRVRPRRGCGRGGAPRRWRSSYGQLDEVVGVTSRGPNSSGTTRSAPSRCTRQTTRSIFS